MIEGVTIAGHTGRVVIEPITSTDGAATVWLRPPDERAKCVWLTASQLRALAQVATERADWLTTNAPYVCALEAHRDPSPEPPAPRPWTSRLAELLRIPTPGRPRTETPA